MALLQECVLYTACENKEGLEDIFTGEFFGCRKIIGRFCIEFVSLSPQCDQDIQLLFCSF